MAGMGPVVSSLVDGGESIGWGEHGAGAVEARPRMKKGFEFGYCPHLSCQTVSMLYGWYSSLGLNDKRVP